MYIEDVGNTDKVLLPCGDHFFFALRVEGPGDGVSFTLPDNLPLELGCSSVIEVSTSKIHVVCIAGSTHVVSCSIAPSTDGLSSSNCLPLIPRPRVPHTSA